MDWKTSSPPKPLLSEVDGQAEQLIIRGHSLDELAGRTRVEDVVRLLFEGFFDDLPTDLGPALGAAAGRSVRRGSRAWTPASSTARRSRRCGR